MIVQVCFDYSINLDRILYTYLDHDTQELKIIFDNGTILKLEGSKEIDSFERYIKHNTLKDSDR